MSEFKYQKPFPISKDTTTYRLLTTDYVSTIEVDGRKILKVDPKGLEYLAKEAFADVSFFLRPAHLEKLKSILSDSEASDNDRFVAHTMLMNQVVSAEGELPTCQDTGTAIVLGKKGEDVYTGAVDAEHLSKGIYDTYNQRNLRYSQVVPFSMFEEKNTGTNLPAQIDIYAEQGNKYEFLFITKGGGSGNKTYLYQQTKSLLNEENLTKFVKEKIKDLPRAHWERLKKHRPVISTICQPKAMKEDRLFAIWNGKRRCRRFVKKVKWVPSLVESILCTMSV
jgi:fumarate hydratase class I